MPLRIIGKNIDIGDILRDRVKERVATALKPIFGERYSGNFIIKKDGHQFHAECHIHISNASDLHSDGKATDAYAACDAAIHVMEKNLRRYKSKLKMRPAVQHSYEASSYVIEAIDENLNDVTDFKPVIVAETSIAMPSLSVGQAVEELDMTGAPFLVFKHAANGRMNIVFKRKDGNVGWIDPSMSETHRLAA